MFSPDEEERWLCTRAGLDSGSCEVYSKILRNDCIFTPKRRTGKTDNSVAQLNDKSIVLIHKIIYDRSQEKVFVFVSNVLNEPVLRPPTGAHLDINDHLLRRITHVEEEKWLLPCEDIYIICFRAQMDHGDFVAPFPNVYNIT